MSATLEGTKRDENGERARVPTKDIGLFPIPRRLQQNLEKPFEFNALLGVTFAFASTFTVANIYYCQPLLIQFAQTFQVSDEKISRVPTLVQAGYATGLLLIAPMGDLVRRRPLLLILVTLSTCLTIPLAITKSLAVFETFSYLVGVFSVTPQILTPLAADLSPPHRKASAIAIVLSGLLFGLLLARVLAGIIAQEASFRIVYYMAIAVQGVILSILYFVVPDVPEKNKGANYVAILYTMAKYAVTEPVLIQAGLAQFLASACYANFWITLTFLLGGPPYNYSTLDIGLFGLIGMVGVSLGPVVGRLVDKAVPWYASAFATSVQAVAQAVQTGAGGINVSAVIIACIGIDIGRQMQQVSLTTAVFVIQPNASARMNAVLLIMIFLGSVMGTAAGSRIFLQFGWRAAAAFALGMYGLQIVLLLIRGPHCKRYTWFGYEGGLSAHKSAPAALVKSPTPEMLKSADEKTTVGHPNAEERKAQDKCSAASVTSETGFTTENV